MSVKSTFAAAALAAFAFAMPALADGIMVEDAYARSASESAKSGAAFMQIVNHSGADDRLVAASSPVAEMVQLHTHKENEAGVMQMVHVEEGFELPVDGTLVLERGGMHVMFMGLNTPFVQGEMIPVTLTFEKAGDMTVDVMVDLERKPGAGMEHGMKHGTTE